MRFLIFLFLISLGTFVAGQRTGQIECTRIGWSNMVISIFYIIMLHKIIQGRKKQGPGKPEPRDEDDEAQP